MIENEEHTCLQSGVTFPVINSDVQRGFRQGLTKALEVIQEIRLKTFNPYATQKNPILEMVENEIGELLFNRELKK